MKPLVIPVFIPHMGCPHQCAFCNQSIITQSKNNTIDEAFIRQTIDQYLSYKGKRETVELAFFGGNFLGLRPEIYLRFLKTVQPFIKNGQVNGVRFSTRPDTITRQALDTIKSYSVTTVELGVQSMNPDVLEKSKRGHTPEDTMQAVQQLKEAKYKTGVQVMVGLPGDSEASLMESTEKLALLCPDYARIYPLLVMNGSLIETWFHQGDYTPLSIEEAVRLSKKMYYIFEKYHVNVIRMGLQASDFMEDASKVIAGPWHPAFGHLVFSSIMFDAACRAIEQHIQQSVQKSITLKVHPKSESRLRGNKNSNIKKLKERYPGTAFKIAQDESLALNSVAI